MRPSVFVLILVIKGYLVSGKNVLILLGDDVGFQFGAYGNTKIRSPNVDALAQRSLLFRNGYTSVSSCSPSRSVILSGLPQHQNGMYGLHQGIQHFASFDRVRSLPVILRDQNILTGIIGKKHVGPDSVYKFDYEATEEEYDLNQIGRNITFMKQHVRYFLEQARNKSRPFMLYIGIHDIHRCGYGSKLGDFCENFGDGMTPGTGSIPDWTPTVYSPDQVEVPYFLPDTPATRYDLANMYKTYSRFDQGVGLFLKELDDAGFSEDTLVIFTSDNGIPFPLAKTNLYDPGQGEPFMISSPYHKDTWGKTTNAMASTMDILPTVLDWFAVVFPSYNLNGVNVKLTGKSLLKALEVSQVDVTDNFDHVFSSHNFHEVTMNYPMRVIRLQHMKLIHNLNHQAAYPLATDLYLNPTFLDILNRTISGRPLPWKITLEEYYHRPEWQLFNLTADPYELKNVANDTSYKEHLLTMKASLADWLDATADPWRCLPSEELEGSKCYPLYNGEL